MASDTVNWSPLTFRVAVALNRVWRAFLYVETMLGPMAILAMVTGSESDPLAVNTPVAVTVLVPAV
jgi:hypothetical protein